MGVHVKTLLEGADAEKRHIMGLRGKGGDWWWWLYNSVNLFNSNVLQMIMMVMICYICFIKIKNIIGLTLHEPNSLVNWKSLRAVNMHHEAFTNNFNSQNGNSRKGWSLNYDLSNHEYIQHLDFYKSFCAFFLFRQENSYNNFPLRFNFTILFEFVCYKLSYNNRKNDLFDLSREVVYHRTKKSLLFGNAFKALRARREFVVLLKMDQLCQSM